MPREASVIAEEIDHLEQIIIRPQNFPKNGQMTPHVKR